MKTYKGSCHCGNVRFEMDTDLAVVLTCNCSFCSRRGAILHPVLPENFRILAGAPGEPSGAKTYGSGIFTHHFCPNCGIQCFSRQDGKGRFAPRVNVNIGCFDPSLLEGLTPFQFDGASMSADSRLWE